MSKKIVSVLLAGCLCCSTAWAVSSTETSVSALSIIASVKEITTTKDVIAVGESVQLELEWTTGAEQMVSFSSSDETIAVVDANGVVTGISNGIAEITASASHGTDKSITITVSEDAHISVHYNASEMTLGTKLYKYDTIHYDEKNIGGIANIVNENGSYDIAFISEEDYVLPFDAELVGIDVTTFYIAPELDSITYVDGRTLNEGDVIDTSTHLLCYDYVINNRVLPVFLPSYYEEYIGEGTITVKEIDHDNKKITLEATAVSETSYSISVSNLPDKTDYKKGEELDLTGLRLNGSVTTYIGGTEEIGCIIDRDYQQLIDNGTPISIDSSEFDSTKAGTYNIYVNFGTASVSFTVTVSENNTEIVSGDINADGTTGVADAVLLKKWLYNAADTQPVSLETADLCKDGKLNVFDLCVMKRVLLNETKSEATDN